MLFEKFYDDKNIVIRGYGANIVSPFSKKPLKHDLLSISLKDDNKEVSVRVEKILCISRRQYNELMESLIDAGKQCKFYDDKESGVGDGEM